MLTEGIGGVFEKVSFEQFAKEWTKNRLTPLSDLYLDNLKQIYDTIQIPERASESTVKYDFKCPFYIHVEKNFPIVIPTGIRVRLNKGFALNIYPELDLAFHHGLCLIGNTVVVDNDYRSEDSGHILLKISHTEGEYILPIQQNETFCQGIFIGGSI